MTPALLLRTMRTALEPLAKAEGGTIDVTSTPHETLSMLGKSPEQWRLILQWEGHEGDEGTMGSSKVGRIAVIIQAAKGMQAERGASAHTSRVGHERSFLEVVALVNTWVRCMIFRDSEGSIVNDDIEVIQSATDRVQVFSEGAGDWLEYEGLQLNQYQTTHSLRYADRATLDSTNRTLTATVDLPAA